VVSQIPRNSLLHLSQNLRESLQVQEELEQRINVNPELFEPFVITTVDGFAIAVGSPKHVLLGQRVFSVVDTNRRHYTIPYRQVAHLSEAQAQT
jgi:hypothetical protein